MSTSTATTSIPLQRFVSIYPGEDSDASRRYDHPWAATRVSERSAIVTVTRLALPVVFLLGASFLYFAIGAAMLGGQTSENANPLNIALAAGWILVSLILLVGVIVAAWVARVPLREFLAGRRAVLGFLMGVLYVGSFVPALGVAVVLRTHKLDLHGFSGVHALKVGALGFGLLGGPVMLLLAYLYGYVES
ncbi:hypothetical protein C8T65DRAFT_643015 [Cerioporus squamosus]|nr:hypothetical protein C8T65DRAFT_643015 [Cerioporus squamosus]